MAEISEGGRNRLDECEDNRQAQSMQESILETCRSRARSESSSGVSGLDVALRLNRLLRSQSLAACAAHEGFKSPSASLSFFASSSLSFTSTLAFSSSAES